MKDYQPISCSFYDRLEEAATLAKEVNLSYYDKIGISQAIGIISTIKTRNHEEFVIMRNGTEIRLDKIHALDGIKLESHC